MSKEIKFAAQKDEVHAIGKAMKIELACTVALRKTECGFIHKASCGRKNIGSKVLFKTICERKRNQSTGRVRINDQVFHERILKIKPVI